MKLSNIDGVNFIFFKLKKKKHTNIIILYTNK